MRVVICVEDPVHRRLVTRVVEQRGAAVTVATDRASDACEVGLRFGVDVVVVDVNTYAADGRAAFREFDVDGRPFHLVVLTGDVAAFRGVPGVSALDRFDPAALSATLERLDDPRGLERRRKHPRPLPPRDPNLTYDPAALFFEVFNDAVDGDVLVVVTVRDPALLDEIGKVARTVTRTEDFVVRQSREVAVYVPGAGPYCGTLDRIKAAWPHLEPLVGVSRMLSGGVSPAEVFLFATREVRPA